MERVKKSETSGVHLVVYFATAHDPMTDIFGWGALIDPGDGPVKTRYEGAECASASTFEAAIVGAIELLAKLTKHYDHIWGLTIYGPQNLVEGIDKITKTGAPGGQDRFKARWLELFARSREFPTMFRVANKRGNRSRSDKAMNRLASNIARQQAGLAPRPEDQEIVLPCPNCDLVIPASLKEDGTVLVDYNSCECNWSGLVAPTDQAKPHSHPK